MTRKDEINNASYAYWVNNYANIEFIDEEEKELHTQDIQDSFINGAEWADQHRRWISVEENLPMECEPVLAAFGNHYARVCFYNGGKWYIDAGVISDEVFGVSHWMQIPPPPKKGE